MARISRRKVLKDSAVGATALAASGSVVSIARKAAAAETPTGSSSSKSFRSDWARCHDRVWLGEAYWSNPLQDWQIRDGRAECVNAAGDRHVHLLCCELASRTGQLAVSVKVRRSDGKKLSDGKGSFGFRIGAQGPLKEYRNSLLYGVGLDAGVTAAGGLFIGDSKSAKPGTAKLDLDEVELRFSLSVDKSSTATLSVHAPDGTSLGKIEQQLSKPLAGNIAIVANFGGGGAGEGGGGKKAKKAAPDLGNGLFSFADWTVEGSLIDHHPDRVFGPILFNMYTLHGKSLKMSVQMPPLGSDDNQVVRLELKDAKSGDWKSKAETKIEQDARIALFRFDDWDAKQDHAYRVVYDVKSKDGKTTPAEFTGTIRKDPVDQPTLTVADISCNGHQAFPNVDYTKQCRKLNPDLMAFVGDQFYEGSGGYSVLRKPVEPAMVDYLRKWYLHGWTWRELTRDRPTVSLPDDHDVYQGNLWGEGGAPRTSTQEAGGYDMDPRWVRCCYRTQTAHHPDSPGKGTAKQGIQHYFGPLTYGRISFAIIADRQYKSGPEGKVPPTGGRGDHVSDPNWDPKTSDLKGLSLLGDEQMKFLREWVRDYRGADLKVVISQTIFTAMATTHGPARERLIADYDANGWPQTERDDALREIRKSFALHLAGDQHLPAVVQYGIDGPRDAGVAFAGPPVNCTYPRWWEPLKPGQNRQPGQSERLGDFSDSFGNPMAILAYANGKEKPVAPNQNILQNLTEKASGLGVVRIHRKDRSATIECWPLQADVTKPGTQFEGWPTKHQLLDPGGRKVVAKLPAVNMSGDIEPVVEVWKQDAKEKELVYAIRPNAPHFEPFVFESGTYTVRVGNPDTDQWKEFKDLQAKAT